MPKRKIIFWTNAELKTAKKCLNKHDNNITAASKELTVVLKRPIQGVAFKLNQIKNIDNPTAERKPLGQGRKMNKPGSALILPQGFSFDFKPTRAEMFKNHVRLYF